MKKKPKELSQVIPAIDYKEPSLVECIRETDSDHYQDILNVYNKLLKSDKYKKHNEAEFLKIQNARVDKLFLLLEYHDIAFDDEERWFKLAWSLAKEHEVGFKVAQHPSGRKTKWDAMLLAGLWAKVQLLIRNKGITESHACELIRIEILKDLKISKKTLENKLNEAKKSIVVVGVLELSQNDGHPIIQTQVLKFMVELCFHPAKKRRKHSFHDSLFEMIGEPNK
jgi:hypothetical protein